jgi:hypothetical protein
MLIHTAGAADGCLRHAGKPVTPAMLGPMLGVSPAEVERMLTRLVELALVELADDGAVRVPWVAEDLERAGEIAEKNAAKGRRSAEVRGKRQAVNSGSTKAGPPVNRGSTVVEPQLNRGSTVVEPQLNQCSTDTDDTYVRYERDEQQQHAGGGAAGDAAAAEAAQLEGDEEHDEALLALAGLGVTGAKALELVGHKWVTVETIQRVKAGMKAGEGSGLLITRLEVDERGRWEAQQAADQARLAAEDGRRRELQDQRERMEREARADQAGDEELLAETSEAELISAMARVPDTRARAAIRTGLRDERGLPIEAVLRHAVAAEVREGRKVKAALARARPAMGLAV